MAGIGDGEERGGTDMFDLFTDEAKRAVVFAQELARAGGFAKIDDRHLALACLHAPAASVAVAAAPVDLEQARSLLERPTASVPSTGHLPFARVVKSALKRALSKMQELQHPSISSAHVLLGVAAVRRSQAMAALVPTGLTEERLRAAVETIPLLDHRGSYEDSVMALVDWPEIEDGVRDELLANLALATLAEGDVTRARTYIGRIDSQAHRAVPSVVLGDVTGFVDLVIEHAAQASAQPDADSASMLSRRAVAHAYRGDAEAARHDVDSAIGSSPSDPSIRLTAAEVELILDDPDAARAHIEALGLVGVDSQPMLGAWRLMVSSRLQESPDAEDLDARLIAFRDALGDGLAESLQRLEIDIARAEQAGRRGEHEVGAALAERAFEAASEAGFGGLALDALVVLVHSQRQTGAQQWRSTAERAVAMAEKLGRTVVAGELRLLE